MSNTAWQYTRRGRLSQTVELVTKPIRSPGTGEIVIEIKAAALNPVDEQMSQASDRLLKFMGALPMGTPSIPASDFSGIVHAVGAGDGRWAVGDEIFGLKFNGSDGNGSLQRYLTVSASLPLAKKPSGLSFVDAAALPLVYSTIYTAFVNYGKLSFDRPSENVGKTVLILGASGGTGSVAVQMARKMGLKVVATGSEANRKLLEDLGVDEYICYRTQNVRETVLKSQYAPFNVVLDCVGGKNLIPVLHRTLRTGADGVQPGSYLTIVGDKTDRDGMGGPVTNYYYPFQALRQFRGNTVDQYLPSWTPLRSWIAGPRYACISLQPSSAQLATIPEFLESAKTVFIDSVYKFEDANAAYEKLESSRAKGKIVVEM